MMNPSIWRQLQQTFNQKISELVDANTRVPSVPELIRDEKYHSHHCFYGIREYSKYPGSQTNLATPTI